MKFASRLVLALSLVILFTIPAFAQEVPVRIKGFDDGVRANRQQDYKEAVLFAKRQAIERAGVKIHSKTTSKNFVVSEDLIHAQSEALLLPGYEILDLGYSENGSYQVVLVGTIRMAGAGETAKGKGEERVIKDPVPKGLVVYYSFDGTGARDLSGKGHDGLFKGNPKLIPGPVGQALSLDGKNDYVVMDALPEDFTQGLSVSVWVKVEKNTRWGRIMDLSNGEWKENIVLGHMWAEPRLMFECMGDSGYKPLLWCAQKNTVSGALAPGEFRHLAVSCTKSGTLYKVEIYVDGEKQQAKDTLGRSNEWTNIPAKVKRTVNYLGQSPFESDQLFSGAVDEFRLYNRPLTAAEVQKLYNQGTP